jgi:diketogulonate reductase-like aldo/keto reductase
MESTLSPHSRRSLAAGVDIPLLGLGTYKALGSEARDAVIRALELGYRGVDTASFYGNEIEVGEGIRESGVPREEIFVATKVWNDEQGYDGTCEALARSLARLSLDFVDLYLVHWPIRAHLADTWRAMESLLDEGLTRSIGVCNFLPVQLEALFEVASTPPVLNQVEFHPWLQQRHLVSWLARHGVALQAWAPIIRGRAAEDAVLERIARVHDVTPAQVAIRWVLQSGHLAIPKSVNLDRLRENAEVFSFELSTAQMAEIAGCDRACRLGPDPGTFVW